MRGASTADRGRLARRTLVILAAIALAGQLGIAPGADAHTGASWCSGTFENTDGHGTGSCLLQFQGLPVGVQGDYLATENDRAKIHVELFAVLADGSKRALLECEDPQSKTVVQRTSASCSSERNDLGVPLTLAEPVPSQIVGLLCEAHSHAEPALGPGSGTFTCWSTEEARQDAD